MRTPADGSAYTFQAADWPPHLTRNLAELSHARPQSYCQLSACYAARQIQHPTGEPLGAIALAVFSLAPAHDGCSMAGTKSPGYGGPLAASIVR